MSRRLMLRDEPGGGGVLPPEYQQVEWIGYYGAGKYIILPFSWREVRYFTMKATVAKLTSVDRASVFPSAFKNSTTLDNNPWGSLESAVSQSTVISPVVTASDTFNFTDFDISFKSVAASMENNLLSIGYNQEVFCPKLRFKSIDIFNADGDLVFHAIMCYRKQDEVIGIYDTVSEVFLESAGTWEKGVNV